MPGPERSRRPLGMLGFGRRGLALALALGVLPSERALAQAAPEPLSTPSRSVAAGDDTSALGGNPALLGFLPAAELRWNGVFAPSGSALPARGQALALGVPFWSLASGLRWETLGPTDLAGGARSRWLRWSTAWTPSPELALGHTLAWSSSSHPDLDGALGWTSGAAWRPSPLVGFGALARDWNRPRTESGERLARSWELGLGLRPLGGHRNAQLALEAAKTEGQAGWRPRATLGLDVPGLGRLQSSVGASSLGLDDVRVMAGLDVHLGGLQAGGGWVGGGGASGGWAEAAVRRTREPGLRLPSKVARLRLQSTPSVRGHTRVLRRLWALADDPETEGLLFVLRAEPASSLAHGEELADALRLLRARGKKVLCALESAGSRALQVCSEADRVVLSPAGRLDYAGLDAAYYYLGGALEKLGVRAEFVRIGAHKSAAEQFTLAQGSETAKTDHQSLVDAQATLLEGRIASGRKQPLEELRARLQKGPFLAREALEAGLVDGLAYDDELPRVMEQLLGHRPQLVDEAPAPRAPERWGVPSRIAVIYLAGEMVDGESRKIPLIGTEFAGSHTVARALRAAREDASVRAVVLRIETGGGSSLAADVILREASLTAKRKPLVVSMGGAAASGGYYAAVAGHKVFANPSTLTGSIGVFFGKADVSGLLEKLGVGVDLFRSGPRADADSLFRALSADEREVLASKVKQTYDLFVGRVAEGRKLSAEAVDAVARGQVWTGTQALDKGLVDGLGGLREALDEAEKRAGLGAHPELVELPEQRPSLLDRALSLAGGHAQAGSELLPLPPGLLRAARGLAPFLALGPEQLLTRSELLLEEGLGTSEDPLGEDMEAESSP